MNLIRYENVVQYSLALAQYSLRLTEPTAVIHSSLKLWNCDLIAFPWPMF